MPDQSQPDLDELQQDYDDPAFAVIQRVTVPVKHDGPITTQELPARTAIAGYVNTVVGTVSQLAPADLRRKNIKIQLTQICYVGHVKQMVSQGEAPQLAIGTLLQLDTTEAVWVMPVTTAGIASYWIAQWAD